MMPRHSTDHLSLAFGLLFSAAGLIVATNAIGSLSLAWIAPVAAIVIGAIIVIAARPASRDRDEVTRAD